MNIQQINITDFYTFHKIMASNQISGSQKVKFIEQNQKQISQIIANANISGSEFYNMMKNRRLIKFKPIKNSFTKRGDKILLAKTLGIEPAELDNYINEVVNCLQDINDVNIPEDKMYALKTYIYRHGSKSQLLAFFDYELTKSKDILKTLYRTLEYNTGGVADYFIRPIHRFDNKTLVKLYNIIDKHLNKTNEYESVTEKQRIEIAKWALIRIYKIQNNNKLKNAIKIKNALD